MSLSAVIPPNADPREIPLWPEGVPPAQRPDAPAFRGPIGGERTDAAGNVANVSEPALTVHGLNFAARNKTAAIVCPGGGYGGLSMLNEGTPYAHWLTQLGITAFVLKYRLKEFGHPAPFQDVVRAIRLVRSRAAEFQIDPQRIVLIGSSAGGHLAASAGTLFDHPAGRTGAALDAVSARPDYLMLLYPVITLRPPWVHVGSREALLGSAPSVELLDLLSAEKQVTVQTPPTLLIHTQEDTVVPVGNSLLFYGALTCAGVPAELHCFARGAHGMGLHRGLGAASDWPRQAEAWLRNAGLLGPP